MSQTRKEKFAIAQSELDKITSQVIADWIRENKEKAKLIFGKSTG